MATISHFLPSGEPCRVLFRSGLRRPLPLNVVRAYVEAATAEGDVVLDPFCQDSSVIQAAVQGGRRAVAASFSPLSALCVRNEIAPPDAGELDAALARLSNTLKLKTPFWRHLGGLYQTRCSACQHSIEADYFIWERDKNTPVQLHYTCGKCGRSGIQGATEQDVRRLERIEDRGFHFSYILGRLAGKGGKGQKLDRDLLEIYTARNLYALTVLLIKIETLFASSEMISVLRLVLLRCLEVGSKLHRTLPEAEGKPRQSLRIPKRFVEVNIWQAFETAASHLKQWKAPLKVSMGADPKAVSAPDLLSVHWGEGERPSVFIGQRSVRELASEIPPESVTLILARAPGFEFSYGALSYLWSGWLFGRPAAERMRARLWHRFPNWPWYVGALGSSLEALGRTLRPENGRVALIYRSRTGAHTEALLLAAGKAGFRAEDFAFSREIEADGKSAWSYRLTLAKDLGKRRAFVDSAIWSKEARDVIRDGATRVLRARAEPVGDHRLRCVIWQRLSEAGLLGAEISGEEAPVSLPLMQEQMETALSESLAEGSLSAVLVGKEESIWWMTSQDGRPPLSDRVEEALRDVLLGSPSQDRQLILKELYRRFPGTLTPSCELIEACLESYGRRLLGDRLTLGNEDHPVRLAQELTQVIEALVFLGDRLGFRTRLEESPLMVLWNDAEDRPKWAFRWRPSAVLSDVPAIEDLSIPHPVLVIPSRRARLIEHKLAKSPPLRGSLEQRGWELLETKRLWELADNDDAGLGVFSASLGLHPFLERDRDQLMLF